MFTLYCYFLLNCICWIVPHMYSYTICFNGLITHSQANCVIQCTQLYLLCLLVCGLGRSSVQSTINSYMDGITITFFATSLTAQCWVKHVEMCCKTLSALMAVRKIYFSLLTLGPTMLSKAINIRQDTEPKDSLRTKTHTCSKTGDSWWFEDVYSTLHCQLKCSDTAR